MEGLSEWLDIANVRKEHIEIIGGDIPSRKFALHCPGAEAGVLRAQALTRAQRDGTGAWRKFHAKGVDGYETNIFIGPDRNAKQIRREVQTKKLQHILQRAAPNGEWWAKRAVGLVFCGSLPVVEILPGNTPNEQSKLAWNPQACAEYSLDKEAINQAFYHMFREVDTSSWSCS
eukprot:8311141-Pyramimonas_sp.AAC.1